MTANLGSQDQAKILVVRTNGGDEPELLQKWCEARGFSSEIVPQYELLQCEIPRPDALALIYPYHKNGRTSDESRLTTLKEQYSSIPIFVFGEQKDLDLLNINNNVKKVLSKDLEQPDSLERLVKEEIEKFQGQDSIRGTVFLYEPNPNESRPLLKSPPKGVSVERYNKIHEFKTNLEFHRDVIDAVVLQYSNPKNDDQLIREIKERVGDRAKIIALLSPEFFQSEDALHCPADFTIPSNLPNYVVQHYIKRILKERVQNRVRHVRRISTQVTAQVPAYNRVFLLMGPSASGKSTVLEHLYYFLGDSIAYARKYSTRKPRQGERKGFDHSFVTDAKFEELKVQGRLLAGFDYRGYKWGISRENTLQPLIAGKHLVLVCPDYERLDDLAKIFDSYGVVPIMLYADFETLEKRLEKRGWGSQKEREKRLQRLRQDEQSYDRNHGKFIYTLFNGDSVNPEQTARKIISIMGWEEKQQHPASRQENVQSKYVDQIIKSAFDCNWDELQKENLVNLRMKEKDIQEYCALQGISASFDTPAFEFLKWPTVAATYAHGHAGIYLRGAKRNGSKLQISQRELLLDLLEYHLRKSGFQPKAQSRFVFPENISHFGLTSHRQEVLVDGLLYALSDDYVLSESDKPHTVSFGFMMPASDMPKPMTTLELTTALQESWRGNIAYNNELIRAYKKTPRLLEDKPS
ncbi:Guanylate kinase [uncultured archaeon]|nr:Guanylate kinase [uncultured archaeon]